MSNTEEIFTIIVAEGPNKQWIRKDAGKIKRFINDLGKDIRDVGRGVRETISPLRWISEKTFSGYGQQMEALREVDDQIKELQDRIAAFKK